MAIYGQNAGWQKVLKPVSLFSQLKKGVRFDLRRKQPAIGTYEAEMS
jgi:hypothetical protein